MMLATTDHPRPARVPSVCPGIARLRARLLSRARPVAGGSQDVGDLHLLDLHGHGAHAPRQSRRLPAGPEFTQYLRFLIKSLIPRVERETAEGAFFRRAVAARADQMTFVLL